MAVATEMLYTVTEVAQILKTGKNFIYKLIKTGELKALKLPSLKIRKSELERFLEKYEGYDLSNPEDIKEINLDNLCEEQK